MNTGAYHETSPTPDTHGISSATYMLAVHWFFNTDCDWGIL